MALLAGYNKYIDITIDSSTFLSGDVSNKVVPVVLGPAFQKFWQDPQRPAFGNEVFFTTSDGTTPIDFQLQSYASAVKPYLGNEKGTWRVKIPTLSASTDTAIRMYYLADSPTDNSNKEAVWDADYKGAYLFDSAQSEGALDDATSNNNNLTDNGTDDVAGFLGRARNFVAVSTDNMTAADSASLSGLTALTITARVKMDDATHFKIGGKSASGQLEWWFGTQGTDKLDSNIYDNTDGGNIRRFSDVAVTGDEGAYVDFALVWDGSTSFTGMTIYRDGAVRASSGTDTGTFTQVRDTTSALAIGSFLTTYADGIIDELTISSIARSADWIIADYQGGQGIWMTFSSIRTLATVGNWSLDGRTFEKRKELPLDSDTYLSSDVIDSTEVFTLDSTDKDFWNNSPPVIGGAVRFTDEGGTNLLEFHVEKYNTTSDDAIWHVKVPRLFAAKNTVIYLYYDVDSEVDGSDLPNTYDSTTLNAWHLNEDQTEGAFDDALGNNDLTNNGTASATGQIGKGRAYDAVPNDSMNAGISPLFTDSATAFRFDCWVNSDTDDFNGTLIVLADTATGNPTANNGFWIGLDDRGGANPTNGVRITFETAGGTATIISDNNVITATKAWHHIYFEYSGGTSLMVVDGVDVTNTVSAGSGNYIPKNANLYLGAVNDGSFNLKSTDLDEVGIGNAAKGIDWAKARYQSGLGTWLTPGAMEEVYLDARTGHEGAFVQYNLASGWTETDPNSRMAVSSDTVAATGMTLNEDARLSKQEEWHAFGGARLRGITNASNGNKTTNDPRIAILGINDELDDTNNWTDGFYLEWVYSGTDYYLNLVNAVTGSLDSSIVLSASTDYFIELRRTARNVEVLIFDANTYLATDYVDTMRIIDVEVFGIWSRLYAMSSYNSGNASDTIDAELRNLSRQTFAITYFTEMARFAPATFSDDFEAGTIDVQWTQDEPAGTTLELTGATAGINGGRSLHLVGKSDGTAAPSISITFAPATVTNFLSCLRFYITSIAVDDEFIVMHWEDTINNREVIFKIVNDGGTYRYGIDNYDGSGWTETLGDVIKNPELLTVYDAKFHQYISGISLTQSRASNALIDGDNVVSVDASDSVGGWESAYPNKFWVGGAGSGVRGTFHDVLVDDCWGDPRNALRQATMTKTANGDDIVAIRNSWQHNIDVTDPGTLILRKVDDDTWTLVTTLNGVTAEFRGSNLNLHEPSGSMYFMSHETDVNATRNHKVYKSTDADGGTPYNLVDTFAVDWALGANLPLTDNTMLLGGGFFLETNPTDLTTIITSAATYDTDIDDWTLGTTIISYGDLQAVTYVTTVGPFEHYSDGNIYSSHWISNHPTFGTFHGFSMTPDEGVTWTAIISLFKQWGNVTSIRHQYLTGTNFILVVGRMNELGAALTSGSAVFGSNIIMLVDRDKWNIVNSFSWGYTSWGGDTANGDITTAGVGEDGNISIDCIVSASTSAFFRISVPVAATGGSVVNGGLINNSLTKARLVA
jgi:hypothetical protein